MANKKSGRRSASRIASASPLGFILDCQAVVALRLARMATGGPQAYREATRMVTEKIAAAFAAQTVAGSALAMGEPGLAVDRVVATYRRAIAANRRRLSR